MRENEAEKSANLPVGTPKGSQFLIDAAHLTTKQREWLRAFLDNGYNAKAAAITAGYSDADPAKQGFDNLHNPKIVALLAEMGLTNTVEVEAAHAQIAFHQDPKDFDEFFAGADLTTLAEQGVDTRLVKKVSIRRTDKGETRTLEFHDRQRSLDSLSKLHDRVAGVQQAQQQGQSQRVEIHIDTGGVRAAFRGPLAAFADEEDGDGDTVDGSGDGL